jgi:hypothetical protein
MFYESVDFIVVNILLEIIKMLLFRQKCIFILNYLINYVIQIIFHSLDREIQCHLQRYHKVIIHDNVNNHTKCVLITSLSKDNKFTTVI